MLLKLALEKVSGHGQSLGNATGREHIHVFELVPAVLEVLQLDEALVHQGIQAVVQPPKADAYALCQFSLAQFRIAVQGMHDPEGSVFLQLGLSAGHECWGLRCGYRKVFDERLNLNDRDKITSDLIRIL